MATNGIIYGARGGNSYGPRLELHWSMVSQDIAKNTTKIKVVSVFSVKDTISYQGSEGKQGSTTVGGITQTYKAPAPSSASQQTRTLGTTYHTITHSSDGSFSGTLSGTFNLGSLLWGSTTLTTISASGSIELPSILRGIDESSIVFKSGWANQDSDKTIEFTKFSSSAMVELIWEYWSSTHGKWAGKRTLSTDYISGTVFNHGTANSYVYTLNPNSKEVSNRYTLNVYQGKQLIQTNTRIVKEALNLEPPTISLTVACSGVNQANLKSETRAVQGVHNMTANVSGTGKNSATIKSFKITFQGVSYSQSTITKKVTQSGTLTITAQIWDSRGATSKTSKTITSIPYSPPKLSNLVASRYDGTSINPTGTDWKVTGTIQHTPITGTDGINANYPSWWFNSESPTYSTSVLRSGSGLSVENSLSWTLTYRDSFSKEYKYIVKIGTGSATFVMGKDSIGIGMVPPAKSKGLYVKDNLINGAVFGGAEMTSNLTVIADGMKNGEVKFFMTSAAYPFGSGNEQFAWGFIARRWEQRYIVAFGLDGKIYTRVKTSNTATWTAWIGR